MAAFSLIYSENEEQTVELNDLKIFQFYQKENICKPGTKHSIVTEKHFKKGQVLCKKNKKRDSLRAFQKSESLPPMAS